MRDAEQGCGLADLAAALGRVLPRRGARPRLRPARVARLPLAVQNALGLMGRGLTVEGIAALTAAHPNITHLKAEMPAVQLQAIAEACGDRLLLLGGQGGLEMTDALRPLPRLRPRTRHGRPCRAGLAALAVRRDRGRGGVLPCGPAGDRVRDARRRRAPRGLRQADLTPTAPAASRPRPQPVRAGDGVWPVAAERHARALGPFPTPP